MKVTHHRNRPHPQDFCHILRQAKMSIQFLSMNDEDTYLLTRISYQILKPLISETNSHYYCYVFTSLTHLGLTKSYLYSKTSHELQIGGDISSTLLFYLKKFFYFLRLYYGFIISPFLFFHLKPPI